MYIIKKDGTKEPFNVQKVVAAVNKSAERVLYTFKPDELDFICRFVTEKCEALGADGIMIAQMHNIVEGALDAINPAVAKSYRDYRNYVNLTIQDGEFVAIIGRSGAGKSTLLRSVNRMHQITAGTLTVNGTDVSTLSGKSLRRFRRGIGMVFQSFNLVTRTTVIKNVLSACVPDMPFWRVLLGTFRKEDKIKALESLDKVGILDKAYMRADQLSGGQQQRVALARTLTQDPRIILADEPVAALDPVTAKQVMQDFVRINQEMGISILLNIHHVELALEYADRIIGIRAGRIVYDGPSANVDQKVLDAIYGDDAQAEETV